MTTIYFNGKTFPVCEHISELKEANDFAFKRFFNKKQMFNFYLNNFIFKDYEGEEMYEYVPETYRFKKACGVRTCVNSPRGDYHIEFVKVEDILPSEAIEIDETDLDWGSCFVKDDNGQVYFVYANED